jgi:hypothetical protein
LIPTWYAPYYFKLGLRADLEDGLEQLALAGKKCEGLRVRGVACGAEDPSRRPAEVADLPQFWNRLESEIYGPIAGPADVHRRQAPSNIFNRSAQGLSYNPYPSFDHALGVAIGNTWDLFAICGASELVVVR